MFDLGLLTIILLTLGFGIFEYRVSKLERKYDLTCSSIALILFWIFALLIAFWIRIGEFEFIPETISSLIIALLTLALVWVELSKRPELKLLDFIPIIYDKPSTAFSKADYHGKLSEPSRFLEIREASFPNSDLKFDENFSFAVDLANIGYQEIMVHEYALYVDGRKQPSIPLGTQPQVERLRLITQQRHPIGITPLGINTAGFHKVKFSIIAATTKRSIEVWFYTSKDLKKLRYVEMYVIQRLLSPLIKRRLKNGADP